MCVNPVFCRIYLELPARTFRSSDQNRKEGKMASADSNPQTKREGLPEDEDSGVSMVEVLEEEEQLEADAKAVLGDSDDKNCTYPLVSWHRLGLGLGQDSLCFSAKPVSI